MRTMPRGVSSSGFCTWKMCCRKCEVAEHLIYQICGIRTFQRRYTETFVFLPVLIFDYDYYITIHYNSVQGPGQSHSSAIFLCTSIIMQRSWHMYLIRLFPVVRVTSSRYMFSTYHLSFWWYVYVFVRSYIPYGGLDMYIFSKDVYYKCQYR